MNLQNFKTASILEGVDRQTPSYDWYGVAVLRLKFGFRIRFRILF
jgi:hypothetical protein